MNLFLRSKKNVETKAAGERAGGFAPAGGLQLLCIALLELLTALQILRKRGCCFAAADEAIISLVLQRLQWCEQGYAAPRKRKARQRVLLRIKSRSRAFHRNNGHDNWCECFGIDNTSLTHLLLVLDSGNNAVLLLQCLEVTAELLGPCENLPLGERLAILNEKIAEVCGVDVTPQHYTKGAAK